MQNRKRKGEAREASDGIRRRRSALGDITNTVRGSQASVVDSEAGRSRASSVSRPSSEGRSGSASPRRGHLRSSSLSTSSHGDSPRGTDPGSPGGSSDVGSYRAPDVPGFFEPTAYHFGKHPELFANDQVEIDIVKRLWLREVDDAVESGSGVSSILNSYDGRTDEQAGEQLRDFSESHGGNGQVVIMHRRMQLVNKLQALTSAIIQRGLGGTVLQAAKDDIDIALQWIEKWTTLACSFVSIFDKTQLCPCGPGERDQKGRPKASRDLQLQHLMQSHLQKEGWTLFQNQLNNTITVFQQSSARQEDGSIVLTPHWRPVRAERQPGHEDHVDAARLFGLVYNKDLLGGEMQDLCNDPAKGDKAVAMLSRNYRSLRVPTCCRTLISFRNGTCPPLWLHALQAVPGRIERALIALDHLGGLRLQGVHVAPDPVVLCF